VEAFAAGLGGYVEAAHRAVLDEAARDAAREGMGATVVAGVALPGRIVVAHVGDSRGVQFRADRVRRLTRDHLFVVDALGLTENVAKRHPQGNILSQALGARDPVQPTVAEFDAAPGDLVVLCSDGVSEVVGEQEMFDLLYSRPAGQRAAALVAAALEAGSRDNCTALVAALP
jgi:protein phosphatase